MPASASSAWRWASNGNRHGSPECMSRATSLWPTPRTTATWSAADPPQLRRLVGRVLEMRGDLDRHPVGVEGVTQGGAGGDEGSGGGSAVVGRVAGRPRPIGAGGDDVQAGRGNVDPLAAVVGE